MKQVNRGNAVRWRGVFKVDGTLTDPTTVALEVREPSGTTTTYTYANATVSKENTGIYFKDVVLNTEGVWKAYMVGTGTCRASDLEPVQVKPDPFI